ncbi:MAG: hypothetical protein IPJ49_05475 [Candidatus Obscuribacter sp.]|nr:hypothetical protein [Candidatus Obscuribacter sp.]
MLTVLLAALSSGGGAALGSLALSPPLSPDGPDLGALTGTAGSPEQMGHKPHNYRQRHRQR